MENTFAQKSLLSGTDLSIPRGCVGAFMFGTRADSNESARIVDAALDAGLNFFDTANMYGDGASEEVLGTAIRGKRHECVIASKFGYGKTADGGEEGTSRAAVLNAVDGTLKRLGTDYIDILYIHRPDYDTPLEETLEALDEIFRAGRIRHFGISNFSAWRTFEILQICDANGWARPVMSQMMYNLLMRQIEHEYVSLCQDQGLHLTVYNPLAGGLLTGKYSDLDDEKSGSRFVAYPNYKGRYWSERFFSAMHKLVAIADDEGLSLTHLSLAWLATKGTADSILLGPSNLAQFEDCLAAGQVELSIECLERISAFIIEFDGTDSNYAR